MIRASVLLAVFSLNTVIGFACSLGLDMGFNSKHHHHDDATKAVIHIHKDGKKHVHHEKKNEHDHGRSHHHNGAGNHDTSKNDDGNCCNDEVLKFEQLDKSFPNSLNIIHPTFATFIAALSYTDVFCPAGVPKDIKQFVRSYHPPISNIRIAIQSFQI